MTKLKLSWGLGWAEVTWIWAWEFVAKFLFMYFANIKSGIGSCIPPKSGFTRHPEKGMYGARLSELYFGNLVRCCRRLGNSWGNLAVLPASKDAKSPINQVLLSLSTLKIGKIHEQNCRRRHYNQVNFPTWLDTLYCVRIQTSWGWAVPSSEPARLSRPVYLVYKKSFEIVVYLFGKLLFQLGNL